MKCSYDYKCPHCNVIWNTDSNNSPPQVGDVVICESCGKGGKITYSKIVFESKKLEEIKNENNRTENNKKKWEFDCESSYFYPGCCEYQRKWGN